MEEPIYRFTFFIQNGVFLLSGFAIPLKTHLFFIFQDSPIFLFERGPPTSQIEGLNHLLLQLASRKRGCQTMMQQRDCSFILLGSLSPELCAFSPAGAAPGKRSRSSAVRRSCNFQPQASKMHQTMHVYQQLHRWPARYRSWQKCTHDVSDALWPHHT